jgi:hypothetical protein
MFSSPGARRAWQSLKRCLEVIITMVPAPRSIIPGHPLCNGGASEGVRGDEILGVHQAGVEQGVHQTRTHVAAVVDDDVDTVPAGEEPGLACLDRRGR